MIEFFESVIIIVLGFIVFVVSFGLLLTFFAAAIKILIYVWMLLGIF